MDCQLMKAIRKLEQNEFYAQKKSILIVASFLLHCNLTAKQNTVTSHRPHKNPCSRNQYLFSAGFTAAESDPCIAPICCLVEDQNKTASSATKTKEALYNMSSRTTQDIPGMLSLLLLLMSV